MKKSLKSIAGPGYQLEKDGSFVIRDYNHAKAFSNFFPGVAGIWGIPMWVFYVNRGQCISSFGTESKDKAILEFQPANKAYRLAPLQGFRTFIKIKSKGKTIFYEPFQSHLNAGQFNTGQTMSITAHDLTIAEHNRTLGLMVRVNYFTLPEEAHAALVRRVSILNHSRSTYQIELIDGLPAIVPYGTTEWTLKNMSRTVEAWMGVHNLNKKAPYYHLKVVVSDKPAVEHVAGGNFYFAFEEGKTKGMLIEPIAASQVVFGTAHDFIYPERFLAAANFQVPRRQETANRTPSAMSFSAFRLSPQAQKNIISLSGYAQREEEVNRLAAQAVQTGFIVEKARRNRVIIEEIKNFAFTNSAIPAWNLYCGQTFLDNVLRGGLPVSLQTKDGPVAFNVYSRKHGDPERDYNFFVLSPTYFSQGNGNYRDVNQNRRNDAWFNPCVKDGNLVNFLNLIQADGYNPLVIRGVSFHLDDGSKAEQILRGCVEGEHGLDRLRHALKHGFQPGELLRIVAAHDIPLKVSRQEFLKAVLGSCHNNEMAEHGEGFWSDHWTYNLDLIESFLAIYPEKLHHLLLERKDFSFHHSAFYVLPRDHRYILTPQGVRQYHSVKDGSKELKLHKDHKLRINRGEGPIYYTSMVPKLLSIIANKAASFDPSGIGIDMEADKPNWYDALNGLPALLGSSLSETFELKRLCLFLLGAFETIRLPDEHQISIFSELAVFLSTLTEILLSSADPLDFWGKANDAKEHYREKVRAGLDGREEEVSAADIRKFLKIVADKTDQSIANGFPATYFTHEVLTHEMIDRHAHGSHPLVRPLTFKRHALPLFLEGFVHALRTREDAAAAKKIYTQVRQSELFDRKLKMYKVNADLSKESEEIGRTRIFPRGWLENESVWLHMEYKYLLEVLRCGLYKEFYQDFKNIVIPFLNPQIYGRSILENSSFIASSAHEDKDLHGQGFVARLSGSTAEFLHIWLLMQAGPRPFEVDTNGNLTLRFRPALAGWLFTREETRINFFNATGNWQAVVLPKNTYSFNFLGFILVVYHNPSRRPTFGPGKNVIDEIHLSYNGKKEIISGEVIPASHASAIRDRQVERIDIFLAPLSGKS